MVRLFLKGVQRTYSFLNIVSTTRPLAVVACQDVYLVQYLVTLHHSKSIMERQHVTR